MTPPLRDFDTGELPAFVLDLDPADLELDAPSGLIPEEAPTLKWLPETTRGRRG